MPDDSTTVFFYGSFINLDVLAGYGLAPESVEVARLSGYDISIAPPFKPERAADDYLDRITGPARSFGFPDWYIERLESFRGGAGG
jgi:hypothetical protein